MSSCTHSQDIRTALRYHPVVALIGARGTGKSFLATALVAELIGSGVRVVSLDARRTDEPADLNEPLAAELGCTSSALTAEHLPEGDVVRVVIDNCHEFAGRSWFPYLQEQWRALLQMPSARGRVGVLLLGRPLFRHVAGGNGSPLLNMGSTLTVRPLSVSDISQAFDVAAEVASPVKRKTGGHQWLTETLLDAMTKDLEKIGVATDQLAATNERYLIRLAEDHTLAGVSVLADLIQSQHPLPEASIIAAHFGTAYADAQDVLADLEGSGLIRRKAGSLALAADLISRSRALRDFVSSPLADIPTNAPDCHAAAAALIYEAENRLRELIAVALGEAERTWWQSRVPGSFIGEAETRRRAELDSPAAPDRAGHPLMYLSIGELFEIVQKTENRSVFELKLRRSAEMMRAVARDLVAVRNKVAHNRPVSSKDLDLARNAAERLGLLGEREPRGT